MPVTHLTKAPSHTQHSIYLLSRDLGTPPLASSKQQGSDQGSLKALEVLHTGGHGEGVRAGNLVVLLPLPIPHRQQNWKKGGKDIEDGVWSPPLVTSQLTI